MRVRPAFAVLGGLSISYVAAVTPAARQAPALPPAASPPTFESLFDQAAVERGREVLVAQCGFCHGSNARGGQSGPDLTRSTLVQEDEGGKQLGVFLRAGRPEQGMPKFDLPEGQLSDLATYLHATIYLAANRRLYRILDIVTGDPKAGEAFFNGAGKCSSCHSATGDLKGVGAKYEPATLQNRLVMPRGGRGGTGTPPRPAYLDRNAVRPDRDAAIGPVFFRCPRTADRFRRHSLRSGDRTAAFVAAQRRCAQGDRDRSVASPCGYVEQVD